MTPLRNKMRHSTILHYDDILKIQDNGSITEQRPLLYRSFFIHILGYDLSPQGILDDHGYKDLVSLERQQRLAKIVIYNSVLDAGLLTGLDLEQKQRR